MGDRSNTPSKCTRVLPPRICSTGTRASKKYKKASQQAHVHPPQPLPNIPFNLPFIPIGIILTHLNVLDVINFALVSESHRNLIENNFKVPAKNLTIIQSYSGPLIKVGRPESDPLFLRFWHLDTRITEDDMQECWGFDVRINPTDPNYRLDFFLPRNADVQEFFMLFSRFLLTVIRTDSVCLNSPSINNKQNVYDMLKWKPRVKGVFIEWLEPKCTIDLEKILGSADHLKLHVYLPKVKYFGPITVKKLISFYASWVTLECLKNMKCEKVAVKGCMLTAEELNALPLVPQELILKRQSPGDM